MTYFVSTLSVSQATTIINAIITFIQYSFSLSLAIVLVRFMPRRNIAMAWSYISRSLNSTIWPILLRVDAKPSGAVVVIMSWLGLLTTGLVAIAGVLLPLGLTEGPLQSGAPRPSRARYLGDNSALALATTPHREQYVYGRICGLRYFGDTMLCPSGSDDSWQPQRLWEIAPSLSEIFNSTPHSPFSMQSRFFSKFTMTDPVSTGIFATAQSFIQRDGMFLAEGVVIDMSIETPGVGLLNHTVPEDLSDGGVWLQDVLWLEPVTACVNTNLTVDYTMEGLPGAPVERFQLTDHGGFFDLGTMDEAPSPYNFAETQADIDLANRAFKGALYSNYIASTNLSIPEDQIPFGESYPLNKTTSGHLGLDAVGHMLYVPLDYLDLLGNSRPLLEKICTGSSPAESTNLTNIGINCGIFLGPPMRVDGGDSQSPNSGSRWTQELHACASSTRASIQQLEFSTSNISNFESIRISRRGNLTVLWGLEKADISMGFFDPFWGRIEERFENDERIWSLRSNEFYLPAGESSFLHVAKPLMGVFLGGPTSIWSSIYSNVSFEQQGYVDYSARSNIALRAKFRSLVEHDPDRGHEQIRNLIWTDIMANSVMGSRTAPELTVVPYLRSLEYDFRFSVPGFLLLLIWVPAFFVMTSLVLFRLLTFEQVRLILNHTSVGRVVVGSSSLQSLSTNALDGFTGKELREAFNGRSEDNVVDDWVAAGGKSSVVLDLTRDGRRRLND